MRPETDTAADLAGYERIKRLAVEVGRPIHHLLALARGNDPFFCGQPAQRVKAKWFAELWQRFGYGTGVHIRRVHYQLVVQHQATDHDGKPYQNTERCWSLLQEAGKAARYLGLVAADAFEDHRNPEPHLFLPEGGQQGPGWEFDYIDGWTLPEIESNLGADLWFRWPDVHILGYDYTPADQPYHLEVWIEKTTQNDVLIPLCQRLGVNLVTAAGFQSITASVNVLKRAARSGKPVRIFFVSDFDPAGSFMPIAVARQIEFWRSRYAPDADVKLTSLALTREQTSVYALPRIPIKDEDRRKVGFEERHGRGAVELDALEALRPGELARILREAIDPYRDEALLARMRDAREEAEDTARTTWEADTATGRRELEEVEEAAREVLDEYRDRLADMNRELQERLAPLQNRLDAVWHAAQQAQERFAVDLPERPEADAGDADESAWLFDARRDYLTQLQHYRSAKRGMEPPAGMPT